MIRVETSGNHSWQLLERNEECSFFLLVTDDKDSVVLNLDSSPKFTECYHIILPFYLYCNAAICSMSYFTDTIFKKAKVR